LSFSKILPKYTTIYIFGCSQKKIKLIHHKFFIFRIKPIIEVKTFKIGSVSAPTPGGTPFYEHVIHAI